MLNRIGSENVSKLLKNMSVDSIGYEKYLYETEIYESEDTSSNGQRLQQMPAYIENHLSEIENELSKDFYNVLDTIDNWKNHEELPRKQEFHIRTILSYLAVSIIKRSPEAIKTAKANKDSWINALAELGVTSSDDIQLMLETDYDRPLREGEIIDFDAMVEQMAVFDNIHPFHHEDTDLMFAHPINQEIFLLGISNMILLKTTKRRPFVGVSIPQLFHISNNKSKSAFCKSAILETAFYFPLSSTLALLCTHGYPSFFS